MWFKYRAKWCNGFGDWSWKDIGEEFIGEFLNELTETNRYDLLDYFLGYEYQPYEFPPKDILEQEIYKCKGEILAAHMRINRFEILIKKYEKQLETAPDEEEPIKAIIKKE